MKNINSKKITNRQQKVLKFFEVVIPSDCSLNEASEIINQIFSNPDKERLWKQYVEKTGDVNRDSSDLKPHNRESLSRVKLADEKPPTVAQKNKISKIYSAEEALVMLADPDFTKEDAIYAIEEKELDLEFEKENFEYEVYMIRWEFLDSDSAVFDKEWKKYGILKPTVKLTKEAVKAILKVHPNWAKLCKEDQSEIFFSLCKNIEPDRVPKTRRKTKKAKDDRGCLFMVMIGIFLLALMVFFNS